MGDLAEARPRALTLRRAGLAAAGALSISLGAIGAWYAFSPDRIAGIETAGLLGVLGLVVLPGLTWVAWRRERKMVVRPAPLAAPTPVLVEETLMPATRVHEAGSAAARRRRRVTTPVGESV